MTRPAPTMRVMLSLLLCMSLALLAGRPPADGNAAVPPPGEHAVLDAPDLVGTLHLHTIDSKHLGKSRVIRVWLPPQYEEGKTYPVLYMHDGQGIFDDEPNKKDSWKLDKTATRLIAEDGIAPVIIVGIDNGGRTRVPELSYTSSPQVGGGDGAKYADFVLEEVMPLVEKEYPVGKDASMRFTGGVSLGALMALEMTYRHPDTFGGLIAMSPSLWWPTDPIQKRLASDPAGLAGTRVYIDMGTTETGDAKAS